MKYQLLFMTWKKLVTVKKGFSCRRNSKKVNFEKHVKLSNKVRLEMIVPLVVLNSSFSFPTENDSSKFFKIRCEYFLPKTDEERLARSL